MDLTALMSLSVGAILFENFVLVRFLGICPFLGVSKFSETATGMGMALTSVMGAASILTFLVNTYALKSLGLEYMQTFAFILIIAALVQLLEMALKKFLPTLYQALGIYLPLITTNCAVLGVVLLNVNMGLNLIESLVHSLSAGLGFTLAISIFASVRERVAVTGDHPKAFEGFPIALVTAALISMAFMGFTGMKIW